MELCIHRDDKAHQVLERFCTACLAGDETYYVIDPKHGDCVEYSLFRFFQFPIFELSKLEMQTLATTYSFDDLLELTWFCYNPRSSFKPCGTCNPCIYTIEEGLGRRLPLSSRLRFHLDAMLRLKHFLLKRPALYLLAKRIRRALRDAS
jgi:hypothetical protein